MRCVFETGVFLQEARHTRRQQVCCPSGLCGYRVRDVWRVFVGGVGGAVRWYSRLRSLEAPWRERHTQTSSPATSYQALERPPAAPCAASCTIRLLVHNPLGSLWRWRALHQQAAFSLACGARRDAAPNKSPLWGLSLEASETAAALCCARVPNRPRRLCDCPAHALTA